MNQTNQNSRLKFITPSSPLPYVASNYFIENFKDRIFGNTANYKNIVAFLPTRTAARTLKECIIAGLFKLGVKNVISLNITTFEDYIAKFSKPQITKLENYSIWLSILLNCDFNRINNLLPDPKNISRKEVLYIAKEIIFLQEKLNNELLSISDAYKKFIDTPDSKRWQDLAFLEQLYNYKTNDLNKITTLQNKLKSIDDSCCDADLENLLIIGNPDITNSLKYFAKKVEENGKNVEVFVFAPPSDKELFDEFAAPKDLEYRNKQIAIDSKDIYVCATPKDESILVRDLIKSYGDIATRTLGIACEQKQTAIIFEDTINTQQEIVIALETNKLSKTSTFDLIKNIKDFLDNTSFETFTNLCLNSFVIDYAQRKGKNIEDILNQLDTIKDKTACKDTQALKKIAKDSIIIELIDLFESINLDNLKDKILDISQNITDEREILALEIFKNSLDSIFTINEGFYLSFNLDEVFTILFEALENETAKIDKTKDSIILQDWMEIFWSKAPHILLCDMNDAIVPLRENNGLFLNDSIRKALSMRTQNIRQARDAYMLNTLAISRKDSSYAISVLLSQRIANGDTLVPSRILFQTKKEDIAKTVEMLFKEVTPQNTNTSNQLEWNLNVPNKAFEGNYSISKFNTYLSSPWIFYLQYILKIDILDTSKEELASNTFGSIYHEILEVFGKSNIKDSIQADEINDFFLKTLDNILYREFKNTQRVQIKIQIEDLKSRLYYTAIQQVKHRSEGWQIIYVEEKFKDYKLADGVLLNGVFDRIDYHKDNGYLIIDYKTKNTADNNIVEKSHKTTKRDKSVVWQNLQMPIYLEVFKHLNLKTDENAKVNCAYFCATKDAQSTKIYHWDNANDYVDEAKKVALDIATKVKNKEFFTFEKKDKYDNFGSVFKLDFELLKNNVKLL